jgi:hypothetical protein
MLLSVMDFIQELFKLAHDGGGYLAPAFVVLWWLERGERLEDRKISEERSQRRDAALAEVKLALATLSAIFNSRPGGVQQP